MPPKTASQQVSAYDTESDPLGAFHQRQNSNAAESSSQSTLTVKEVVGDIFDAPPNTVLIHACNCIGDWGAGIAAAFKKLYPSAYKFHRDFCANSADGKAQIATAQLIPPVDGQERRHYIGCLFTSVHYGRRRDSPDAILRNTGPAMEDLLRQLAEISKTMEVGEVRTCKINSGLFGVPWEKTLEVLQKIKLEPGMPTTVTVFERA
ncbi:Appr-1-p processing [Macrophomina phaseolina MS6]|uniref:ADP-ribose 1''-phosphate phosphatase n=2 Tax=Macrophomina phaseolina TaxID=35725 RepID=K2REJ4_MACPH|nr:Appr-1-p processing [Macrophomina phaseolina MS6]KAH7030154.1 ADP-ribose 1''-phosphate phosphatase [Macrophomina phaseolina]